MLLFQPHTLLLSWIVNVPNECYLLSLTKWFKLYYVLTLKFPHPYTNSSGLILHCLIKVVERICLKIKAFSEGFHFIHPRRSRGSQSGREKRRDEIFQARAEEPLGTDPHRIISERSSERRLLIGHKKCFVLLCPIGEQHLLSSFRELVHGCYSWVSEDAFHQKKNWCWSVDENY